MTMYINLVNGWDVELCGILTYTEQCGQSESRYSEIYYEAMLRHQVDRRHIDAKDEVDGSSHEPAYFSDCLYFR